MVECGHWSDRDLPRVLLEEARHVKAREPDFAMAFREAIAADDNVRGNVLDVGCGSKFPAPMWIMPHVARELHGVDPSPQVHSHAGLHKAWEGVFEQAPLPESHFDLAYAWNVVEHIEQARPFFTKLERVLRPGGTFWALTPHARHPFAKASRAIEVMGLKQWFAARSEAVNKYPAYYRLNTRTKVIASIAGLRLEPMKFDYFASGGWWSYFPRVVQPLGRLYHHAIEKPFPRLAVVFMYGLRRTP